MAETMFKTLAFFLSIYALLPTALARLFHFGVKSRVPAGAGRVALTFDDGPDPRYTPQVLNILKEYQVKACFFVLGRKARAHPELVARIHQEGHEVASHGYNHHLSWLLGPRGIRREVQRVASVIEEITGQPPRLFRPPWGLLNLYSLFLGRLHRQQVVLWSFLSWDWGRRSTPDSIARRVLSRVKDGSILVFHDSDDAPFAAPGASGKMLSALPAILTELKARNLEITPLKELFCLTAPGKSLFARLWQQWEKLFRFLFRIEDVFDGGKPTMFRVALRRYRGKTLPLPDGTVLRRGDLIGELHMHNEMLREINAGAGNDPAQMAFAAKKAALQALAALAGKLAEDPRYQNVKAVAGVSILHRGSRLAGFSAFAVSPLTSRLVGWYENLLLAIFHPAGKDRVSRHRKKLTPRLLVMSREELFRRYLDRKKGH